MAIADDLITFVLGLIGGVAIIVFSSFIMSSRAEKQSERSARADLVAELQQNHHHQEVSFMIPLEDGAYGRFRQAGYLMGRKMETQEVLRHLYSLIRDKNGLVAIYLSKGDVEITGGQKPERVLAIIDRLRKEIDQLITGRVLYLLEK